ncbi:MAG: hypothetical protein PHD92_06355 [Eubacteriales bacterium]|nr:hypothetical protein [Eubacteriales bacterium]
MALLKGIYMTDVEWYNGTTWVELKVEKSDEPGTTLSAKDGHIILQLHDDPQEVPVGGGVSVDVNFSKIHMLEAEKPTDEYTVFSDADCIPADTKSPIIRYKLAVGTWTSEEIITVNPNLHYMMLNASFPANAYADGGTIDATAMSSSTLELKFYFPAFTSSQLSAEALTLFKDLLSEPSNWSVTNTGPSKTQTRTPTSVTIAESPLTSGVTDYGLAKILVTLNVTLSFPISGTYTLTATFQSNDGDTANQLPGSHTIAATIQVNTGSTTPFMCSLDDDAVMMISIA